VGKHRAPDADPTDFDAATSALVDVTGDYEVDAAHTRIGIRARHAMVTTVRGSFGDFSGTAHLDVADPAASSVSLRIRTASIDTGTADRDAHLRSADFLDVETHPAVTFRSTRVVGSKDSFEVTGDLTIRDVTRPITLDVTFEGTGNDPWGGTRASFSATGKFDRRDYGLTWNVALEAGGILVSNEVKIQIEAQAVLQR
jgi:polyisoprenoid-binding protein YceI